MRTRGSASDSSQPPSSQGNPSDAAQTITDRARDIAGTAREKLADVGSSVRDRAGGIKDSLADALESGADKLRNRAPEVGPGGVALAGATGASVVDGARDHAAAQMSQRVAGGMQATASWLRDADAESLKAGLERQVKEHPGRTLLIAVGVGYLIGKAFRR
ncbi:MAG: hypothetical protein ACREPM_22520 [Gemmatimonadaceae bacterium]